MLGGSIRSGLDYWLLEPASEAMVQLAQFLLGAECVARGVAHWREVPIQARREVVDWLYGEAVEAALVDAVDKVPENDRWRFDSAEASARTLKSIAWR